YDYPTLPVATAKELADAKRAVPSYVSILPPPIGWERGAGFLPAEFGPLEVRDQAALSAGKGGRDPVVPPVAAFEATNKARGAAMRAAVEKAFALSAEKDAVREAYGRTTFGQSCLLARRLVEAGVPVVEVSMGGWDAHARCAETHKELSKRLDPAFA